MPDRENGKKRMKIIFFIIIMLIIDYLLYIAYFEKNEQKSEVVVLKDESFLSEFEVIKDEVHIYCEVSLKNNSSDTKKIKLTGDFQKEAENGLLKEDSLKAYFIEFGTDNVVIEGNSSIKHIKIDFAGEYAGNPHMRNRLLPDIEVVEIK